MKSMLEELLNGNLKLADRSSRRGSEYSRAADLLVKADDRFCSMLNESQIKAYKDVRDAQYKVNYMELKDRFIYGFRMGLLIAMEVYNTSDDFVVDGT